MEILRRLLVFGLSSSLSMTVATAHYEYATQGSGASSACAATLDGVKFPYLVPEQFSWEVLFEVAVRDPHRIVRELNVTAATNQLLSSIAADAQARAVALRRAPVPSVALMPDREAEAAEAILEGRDSLIRQLSPTELDRLLSWVAQTKRNGAYSLPVPAKPTGASATPCLVTVSGREFPHLIPEPFYWEFYFRMKVLATEGYKTADGRYTPEHVKALQQHHLRIPDKDIITVLDIAAATIGEVDQLRSSVDATPEEDRLPFLESIARAVMQGRADLLRRLPVSFLARHTPGRSPRAGCQCGAFSNALLSFSWGWLVLIQRLGACPSNPC